MSYRDLLPVFTAVLCGLFFGCASQSVRIGNNYIYSKALFGEDKFAVIHGYRVHYVEAGTGYPVLLIPGSNSTYRAWNALIPYLSGYTTIAVDYIGTGDSDKPEMGFFYTIEEQADIIAQLIHELGFDKVNLIGVSYGGAIVLNLAARYPYLICKVVSIEGGVVSPKELPTNPMDSLLGIPIIGDLFIATAKTGMLNEPVMQLIAGKWYPRMTDEEKKNMLEEMRFNVMSAERIPWYWINISNKTTRNFEEQAKGMTTPVLYLYGQQSDFLEIFVNENVRFFRTYLPNVRIVSIEDGIHDLETQKPAEVARLTVAFFENE